MAFSPAITQGFAVQAKVANSYQRLLQQQFYIVNTTQCLQRRVRERLIGDGFGYLFETGESSNDDKNLPTALSLASQNVRPSNNADAEFGSRNIPVSEQVIWDAVPSAERKRGWRILLHNLRVWDEAANPNAELHSEVGAATCNVNEMDKLRQLKTLKSLIDMQVRALIREKANKAKFESPKRKKERKEDLNDLVCLKAAVHKELSKARWGRVLDIVLLAVISGLEGADSSERAVSAE